MKEESTMTGTSLEELHEHWLKERPGYKEAYDALEEEFKTEHITIKNITRSGTVMHKCLPSHHINFNQS